MKVKTSIVDKSKDVCYNCLEGKCKVVGNHDCEKECSTCNQHRCKFHFKCFPD